MTNADVFVRECAVNATEGYLMYEVDTPMRETVWEEFPERGEFYRFCSREFGRCVSKMFVDDANGEAIHVGYVFQKRERYEDTGDPFVRETWVGFVTKTPPTILSVPLS